MDDLDFILSHIDDLNAVFTVQDGEVQMADRGYALPFGLTLQGRETSPQPFSAAD
jgi:hypothetical protein